MITFEELLKQEKIDYCISAHGFDSGLSFEELLALFRDRGLPERKDARFLRVAEPGSAFNEEGDVVFYVWYPAQRTEEAEKVGITGLRSHINIHLGKNYGGEEGIEKARQELRKLVEYHFNRGIPAACYHTDSFKREFHAVNIGAKPTEVEKGQI
jgi:hypothetical protein